MLDQGPVNIRGAVRGSRARVVYKDGTLLCVLGEKRIRTFHNVDAPVESRGVWTAHTTEGDVQWTRRGCSSCGWSRSGPSRVDVSGLLP